MNFKYSDKERHLLHYFDVSDTVIDNIQPTQVYRMAVENAFIDKYYDGHMTESLRSCAKALRDSSVTRLTPEWDAMINLD
jgi:hypothetical protein